MMHSRLPAEWVEQDAVILTWPHAQSDWAPRLPRVEPAFAAITKAIADHERVILVIQDEAHRQHIMRLLTTNNTRLANIKMYPIATNDTWVRDYGPLTIAENGKTQLLDFRFNGWGGKYPAELDDRVTRHLQEQNAFGKTNVQYSSIIMEGGSLDTDGEGTLLTTERCLLGPTRNPAMTKHDYERLFKAQLGMERVLWLAHGELQGDDTDGHVDMLARFCDRRTIAYVHCDDKNDFHHAPLSRMRDELLSFRTADGQPYRLVPLPFPAARYHDDGRRLPASYANFLIINGAVLLPTYDDPADTEAIARLQDCFPDRKIIGIPCLPIIEQNGSLHCCTMQLPKGTCD